MSAFPCFHPLPIKAPELPSWFDQRRSAWLGRQKRLQRPLAECMQEGPRAEPLLELGTETSTIPSNWNPPHHESLVSSAMFSPLMNYLEKPGEGRLWYLTAAGLRSNNLSNIMQPSYPTLPDASAASLQ